MRPAEAMYTGQQHVRLMRGVRRFKDASAGQAQVQLDVHILSAGYGLLAADRLIAPYEATFVGMARRERRAWAEQLRVRETVGALLAEPYSLGMLLLGRDYIYECGLPHIRVGGPTLAFCGERSGGMPWQDRGLKAVPLTNDDARRFACGMTAIKGELAARVLSLLAQDLKVLDTLVAAHSPALLDALAGVPALR